MFQTHPGQVKRNETRFQGRRVRSQSKIAIGRIDEEGIHSQAVRVHPQALLLVQPGDPDIGVVRAMVDVVVGIGIPGPNQGSDDLVCDFTFVPMESSG
jgi:hypothetical protein